MRAVPRFVQVEVLVEFFLLQVGQQKDAPTVERLPRRIAHGGGREAAVILVIAVHRQDDLFEIVARNHPVRCVANGSSNRHEQETENGTRHRKKYTANGGPGSNQASAAGPYASLARNTEPNGSGRG